MLQNNFFRHSIMMLSLLFAGNIFAQNTLPLADDIDVTADAFTFDNVKGIASYQGHVLAKQEDNRQLTGDDLKIYRDIKTGEINKIIIHGNPAKYQGNTENNEAILTAMAKKITYFPKTEYFVLEENAEISQGSEYYRAPRMEYDAKIQKMYSPSSLEGHTSILLKKSLQ